MNQSEDLSLFPGSDLNAGCPFPVSLGLDPDLVTIQFRGIFAIQHQDKAADVPLGDLAIQPHFIDHEAVLGVGIRHLDLHNDDGVT